MSLGSRIRAFFSVGSEQFSQEVIPNPIDRAISVLAPYGSGLLPRVSREEALSVPEVMKARNMICNISTLPLVTYRKDWSVEDNRLFRQIDPAETNVWTLNRTVEDLFFREVAYWQVLERGADDYPTSARYIDFERVSENDEHGRRVLRIDGKVVPWREIIRFRSPNPALLDYAGRVIRQALDLDETAAKYARNPKPLDYFKSTDPMSDPFDDDGVRALLKKWRTWLKRYTTGYVPAGLEYVTVDQPTPAEMQLVEAQKQVAIRIANMTGLEPEDFGVAITSDTYQNSVDRRMDRINQVLAAYMQAVTQRLSMGDVTKNGYTVAFDLDDYLRADPKTRMEVQVGYKAAGVISAEEIRTDERLAPGAPPAPRALPAGPAATTNEEATSGNA